MSAAWELPSALAYTYTPLHSGVRDQPQYPGTKILIFTEYLAQKIATKTGYNLNKKLVRPVPNDTISAKSVAVTVAVVQGFPYEPPTKVDSELP